MQPQQPTGAAPNAPGVVPTVPPQPSTPPANAQPNPQLEASWKDYLKNPAVQAAMLQFTVNMMSPAQPGQGFLGHLAGSIGAGGEAANRVLTQQDKDKMDAANLALRQRQVSAEEQNAQTNAARIPIEQDANAVAREKIKSDQGIADEQNKSRETIARIGLAGTMAQIKATLQDHREIANKGLLQEIIKAESDRYKTEAENEILRVKPVPPTVSGILQQYQLYSGALNNSGRLPDQGGETGLVKDSDVLKLLNNPDPLMQAKGRQVLGFLSQTQIARILQSVVQSGQTTPTPIPSPSSVPAPKQPAQIEPPAPFNPSTLPPTSAGSVGDTSEKRPYSSVSDAEKDAMVEKEIRNLSSHRGIASTEMFGLQRLNEKFTGMYRQQQDDLIKRWNRIKAKIASEKKEPIK